MSKINSNEFINILRKFTIKKRMVLSFFIICFIPILFVVAIYFISTYIEQETRYIEYAKNYLYQANLRINSQFNLVIKKMEQISNNNDILADIYLYENSLNHKNEKIKNRIEVALNNILNNQEDIEFTSIYTESDEVFSYGINEFDNSLIKIYDKSQVDNNNIYWDRKSYNDKNYILASKKIKLRYDKYDEVYIVIALNIERLENLLDEISVNKNHQIIITDANNRVLVHKDKSRLYKEIYANKIGDFSFKNEIDNDWNIIHIFKFDNKWSIKLLSNIILVIIFIFIFAIMILYFATKSIVNPLNKLIKKMKDIEKSNITEVKLLKEDEELRDEQSILEEAFDQMIIKLQSLVEYNYNSRIKEKKLQSLIKELELNALQQQINPHFLYNVLENIFWIADMNGYEEIGEMISELGNYFKTSVSENNEFISILSEIENIKSYISLQKLMNDNNFEVKWELDDEVLNYKTIKLILQPIIENSIIHGLYNKKESGVIMIKCTKDNSKIVFEVHDNGCGIQEEKLNELIDYINSKENDTKKSVGIKNVNQRIRFYFGNDYGISISSQVSKGTRVKLVVPIKE